jgi:hypothetical protein
MLASAWTSPSSPLLKASAAAAGGGRRGRQRSVRSRARAASCAPTRQGSPSLRAEACMSAMTASDAGDRRRVCIAAATRRSEGVSALRSRAEECAGTHLALHAQATLGHLPASPIPAELALPPASAALFSLPLLDRHAPPRGRLRAGLAAEVAVHGHIWITTWRRRDWSVAKRAREWRPVGRRRRARVVGRRGGKEVGRVVRKAKGEVAAGALRATEHVAKDSESRADESAMARARCVCGMKVERSTTKG